MWTFPLPGSRRCRHVRMNSDTQEVADVMWQSSDKLCGSRSVTPRWALITHDCLFCLISVFLAPVSIARNKKWVASCTLQRDVRACVRAWLTKPSDSRGQQRVPGWDACRLITVWDDCFKLLRLTEWKITHPVNTGGVYYSAGSLLFSAETQT